MKPTTLRVKFTETGDLEHTKQPADTLPDWRGLLPGDSVNLNLFMQAHIQFYHYQFHKMGVGYMSQWML